MNEWANGRIKLEYMMLWYQISLLIVLIWTSRVSYAKDFQTPLQHIPHCETNSWKMKTLLQDELRRPALQCKCVYILTQSAKISCQGLLMLTIFTKLPICTHTKSSINFTHLWTCSAMSQSTIKIPETMAKSNCSLHPWSQFWEIGLSDQKPAQ